MIDLNSQYEYKLLGSNRVIATIKCLLALRLAINQFSIIIQSQVGMKLKSCIITFDQHCSGMASSVRVLSFASLSSGMVLCS